MTLKFTLFFDLQEHKQDLTEGAVVQIPVLFKIINVGPISSVLCTISRVCLLNSLPLHTHSFPICSEGLHLLRETRILTAALFSLTVVLKLTGGFTQKGTAKQWNNSWRYNSLHCDRRKGRGERLREGLTPVKRATPYKFPFLLQREGTGGTDPTQW